MKPTAKLSTPNLAALPHVMQELFTEVADQLAREHQVIKRQRSLTGSSLAQSLVLGWLEKPEARLTDLAQTTGLVGTPISPQALAKRLEQPNVAAFLRALFERASSYLFAAERTVPPGLLCFEDIEISDGSVIHLPGELRESYPGCGKPGDANYAGIKLLTKFNWVTGAIRTELLLAKDHDRISEESKVGGRKTLYLRDLGFFKIKALKAEGQAGHSFITRIKSGVRIYRGDNQQAIQDMGTWLKQHVSAEGEVDEKIMLGKKERLACRLVARRVPEEVLGGRIKQAQLEAIKRLKPSDHFVKEELAWDIRITNVGCEQLKVVDIFLVYCLRWQIELLFKLLKSEHRVDESRSKHPQRCLSEVLAKLLGALVQHWCVLATTWQVLDSSLVLLSRAVRRCVVLMIGFLRGEVSFEYIKGVLLNIMRRGVSIQKRRRKPNALQKLESVGA